MNAQEKQHAADIVPPVVYSVVWIGIFFALFNAVFAAMLSITLLIVVRAPFRSRWQTWEAATASAWLFGAVVMFSNVVVDGLVFLFYLVTSVLLGLSWTFRELHRLATSSSKIEWVPLGLVPLALLTGWILFVTDVDLHARLALSEPALRADVPRIGPGHEEQRIGFPRRLGLFWAHTIEERQGCVCWTTGGTFMNYHGLAYIPGAAPTNIGYDFQHLRGPWWAFEFRF